jgi:hypothetical protein
LKNVNQSWKIEGYEHISSIELEKRKKIGKNGNRKTNFIVWNFKDKNNEKIQGKEKEI